MEVDERYAGSRARNSTHGVSSTQAERTARFFWERPMSAGRPPMLSAQRSESSASSTHSIDGVLMVEPLKMSSLSLPPLVMRKILGSGHGGVYDSRRSTA